MHVAYSTVCMLVYVLLDGVGDDCFRSKLDLTGKAQAAKQSMQEAAAAVMANPSVQSGFTQLGTWASTMKQSFMGLKQVIIYIISILCTSARV